MYNREVNLVRGVRDNFPEESLPDWELRSEFASTRWAAAGQGSRHREELVWVCSPPETWWPGGGQSGSNSRLTALHPLPGSSDYTYIPHCQHLAFRYKFQENKMETVPG